MAAAGASKVYVSNGSGSGTWQKISTSEIDTSLKNLNKVVLSTTVEDLSAATSHWVVTPIAGTITSMHSVIDGALATADTTLTMKIATVAVTNGALTIAYSGSATGDVDVATPSGANTVTAGQAIEIVCGGETTTNKAAHITILMNVA